MMCKSFLEETTATVEFFEQRLRMALKSLWRCLRLWAKRLLLRLGHFLSRMKHGLLAFCRTIYRLVIASSKLSLFYLPGVLGWLIGWKVFALTWLITITALGMFYGKRKPLRS